MFLNLEICLSNILMIIVEYRGPICVDSSKNFYHHLILMSNMLKIFTHYDTTEGTYN